MGREDDPAHPPGVIHHRVPRGGHQRQGAVEEGARRLPVPEAPLLPEPGRRNGHRWLSLWQRGPLRQPQLQPQL